MTMKTIFIPLPVPLRRPIGQGCSCPYCKAHPGKQPQWDTLAYEDGASWIVHYPELTKMEVREHD